MGTVIGFNELKQNDNLVRLAIYQYEYQGKTYTYNSQDIMNSKDLRKRKKTLKVLTSKPNIVIEDGLLLNWALPVLGFCFIISGIITLLLTFINTGK